MNILTIIAVFISFLNLSTAHDFQVEHDVVTVYFNKSCLHDDHCYDFRMICENEACVCSRFYKWNDEEKECILQLDILKEFLASMKEERDIKSELNEESHRTYFFFALSGLLTASLGLLGVLACVCVLCLSRLLIPDDEEACKLLSERKKKMTKDGDGGLADVAATTFKSTF